MDSPGEECQRLLHLNTWAFPSAHLLENRPCLFELLSPLRLSSAHGIWTIIDSDAVYFPNGQDFQILLAVQLGQIVPFLIPSAGTIRESQIFSFSQSLRVGSQDVFDDAFTFADFVGQSEERGGLLKAGRASSAAVAVGAKRAICADGFPGLWCYHA